MPSPNRISVTRAPVVYDGKIFVGQTGDFGGWTVMSAIDAESGESVWHQRTSPLEQWVEDAWRYSSTAPWLSPSIDPEPDTVFWSIGNPNPWFFPSARPGPNKYADSVIALDVESGKMKWVNQILPHDVWDYDNHMSPAVFDMEVERTVHLFDRIKDDLREAGIEDLGAVREAMEAQFDDLTVEVTEERRVVSTDFKTGHTYVFDVETGRLIERSNAWAKQEHEWADSFLSLSRRWARRIVETCGRASGVRPNGHRTPTTRRRASDTSASTTSRRPYGAPRIGSSRRSLPDRRRAAATRR